MKTRLLVLATLWTSSCALPSYFEEGGPKRGIVSGFNNDWVDLRVEKITPIGPVVLVGPGLYAVSVEVKIGMRRTDWNGVAYHGRINKPFWIQFFLRPKNFDEEYKTVINEDGKEEVVKVADTLLLPVALNPFERTAFGLGEDVGDTKNLPYGYGPPPPVTPTGALIQVSPPFLPKESRVFQEVLYFNSTYAQGTRLQLVVRVDIYNDIHPEHDGGPLPDSSYRAPDFQTNAPSNNEGIQGFDFVVNPMPPPPPPGP